MNKDEIRIKVQGLRYVEIISVVFVFTGIFVMVLGFWLAENGGMESPTLGWASIVVGMLGIVFIVVGGISWVYFSHRRSKLIKQLIE
jgi:uncharacterized membrane protein